MSRKKVIMDGCGACAHVVHATSEIITIYPITPSSPIAEHCDAKSAAGKVNIWGNVPKVGMMQSEAGVAGAVHGSLAAGALATTVTASQGLLLVVPNMYKIAGELTPVVFSITARSLAAQGLSIFGDHSDVMGARSTGFAMLCSKNVQEAMDFALIAQSATLESRIPFMHFFDGFRTSHEEAKIEELTFDDMRAMINNDHVIAHRSRGLSPDNPTMRGTAQNPDVYFQGRETVNKYYNAVPGIVQKAMNKFAKLVKRQYKLFDYYGDPKAERVAVILGSAGEVMQSTIDYLNAKGEKLGLIQVRLYRPFDTEALASALPATVKAIAVLDRTKEPGAIGEPLYLDVRTAVGEAIELGVGNIKKWPIIVGGRYGLGSKDFTPGMAKAVYDNLAESKPKNHFTIGINDDVTKLSLNFDKSFNIEGKDVYRAMFYGLGADGTVGANKNTIKIIGGETENYAQGYFVYDSKKSGSITTSHVRFGKEQISNPYLISQAQFIACHNTSFLEKYDMLANAEEGATFLLTTSDTKDTVWDKLPKEVQQNLIAKKMKFYIIDAIALAEELGLGSRINMIMQTAFFVISNVIPKDEAINAIKAEIKKTYQKKGDKVVNMNYAAVDVALKNIVEVPIPKKATSKVAMRKAVSDDAPAFVKKVTATIIQGKGDSLPVSAMPNDGVWPTATTQYEKRAIAVNVPIWESDACIQCATCSFVCPHAAIRVKVYNESDLANAPQTFKSLKATGAEFSGMKFTVQVAPEDCVGCGSCVEACPGRKKDAEGKRTETRAINMTPLGDVRAVEAENYKFFLSIPEIDQSKLKLTTLKGTQLVRPLFEYSGCCAGCGETPYIKLLTQLFGDRLYIGNATGCSSIYGGNLPTTPYAKRSDGRGPTWANSLFEDNAEFALGMRQTVDYFTKQATELLDRIAPSHSGAKGLIEELKNADQSTQEGIEKQRGRVDELLKVIANDKSDDAKMLKSCANYLVKKTVWALGGDGWGYDIGYSGVDQALASGENINIMIMDTEVYSNTGGQMSKATQRGATAQFAAAGKSTAKKQIGLIMATYGNVYVAQTCFGANPSQIIKAMIEAEAHDGPSLIIAYSPCIAHGCNLTHAVDIMKEAVACGYWPLYRYNPALEMEGKSPMQIDCKEPTFNIADYAYTQTRYMALKTSNPERAAMLMKLNEQDARRRWEILKHWSSWVPTAQQ
ncbi:MAG: pyruvate:ferredoxin (flavodoxin) oxidoreductase [Candidatus Magnetominusculus sp. LBB02]|nr:pyruvate:ferredoxin (flavodoxin) oxidoreductase [Candidatus Magnetominusculus sp. LBB02]